MQVPIYWVCLPVFSGLVSISGGQADCGQPPGNIGDTRTLAGMRWMIALMLVLLRFGPDVFVAASAAAAPSRRSAEPAPKWIVSPPAGVVLR